MAERPIKAERKNTDMTVGVLKTLGTFLVFLLVQVLVLNHVHLFDSATPLLYIYGVALPAQLSQVGHARLGLCLGHRCGYVLQYARCGSGFANTCGPVKALPFGTFYPKGERRRPRAFH